MTSHKATCLPAAVASSPLLKKVIAFTCERSTRVAGEPWQRPIARPRCPERDGCSIAACGPQLPTGRRERQVPISAGNGGVESLPRSHAAARWRSRPSLHCPRRGQAARASSDRPRQPPWLWASCSRSFRRRVGHVCGAQRILNGSTQPATPAFAGSRDSARWSGEIVRCVEQRQPTDSFQSTVG